MLSGRMRNSLILAIFVSLLAAGCQSSSVNQEYADLPVTDWPSYQAVTALRTSGGE